MEEKLFKKIEEFIKKNYGKLFVAILILILMGTNFYFLNDKTKREFYQKGVQDANNVIVSQVLSSGQLIIRYPDEKGQFKVIILRPIQNE